MFKERIASNVCSDTISYSPVFFYRLTSVKFACHVINKCV